MVNQALDEAPGVLSGFNLESKCTTNSTVRNVVYCPRWQKFAVLEDRCLRLWRELGKQEEAVLHFSTTQTCFLTDIADAPELELLLAPSLERTLKVLDEKLRVVSSFLFLGGPTLAALYCPSIDRVVSAGGNGIRMFKCGPISSRVNIDEADEESFIHRAVRRSGGQIPSRSLSTRKQSWWRAGKKAQIDLVGKFALPSDDGEIREGESSEWAQWASDMELVDDEKRLKVVFGSTIAMYPLDQSTWHPAVVWRNLHSNPISTASYVPSRSSVLSASRDGSVKMWSIEPGGKALRLLKDMGTFTKPVMSSKALPSEGSILVGFLDGTVALWSLQTFESLHQIKAPEGDLRAVKVLSPKRFLAVCALGVRKYRVDRIHETLSSLDSKTFGLAPVKNAGVILAKTEDTAVRLISCKDGEPVSTTTPVAKSTSVLEAKLDDETLELFVLTADNSIRRFLCTTNPSTHVSSHEGLHGLSMTSLALCSRQLLPPAWPPERRKEGHQNKFLGPQKIVLAGIVQGEIAVYDSAMSMEFLARLSVDRFASLAAIEVEHSSARLFALAGSRLHVYDIEGGFIPEVSIEADETLFAIRAARKSLLLAGTEGSVLVHPERSAATLSRVGYHFHGVADIAISPDAKHFVSCSPDGNVTVYSSATNWANPVAVQLDGELTCTCFSPDGRDLMVSMDNKILRLPLSYFSERASRLHELSSASEEEKEDEDKQGSDEEEGDDGDESDARARFTKGSQIDWGIVAVTPPESSELELGAAGQQGKGSKKKKKRKKRGKKKKAKGEEDALGWSGKDVRNDQSKIERLKKSDDPVLKQGSQELISHDVVTGLATRHAFGSRLS